MVRLLLLAIFCLISPSALFPVPQETPLNAQSINRLKRLIEEKKWDEVNRYVRAEFDDHEITFADLKAVATFFPGTPFGYAVKATQAIMDLKEKTGLSEEVTFPIALFAETELRTDIAKRRYYWPDHRFGRELQYDKETARFFIHLGTKHVEPIGEGRKKVVTNTILYDRSHPVVMARGVCDCNIRPEMKAMEHLRGLPGLLQAEALMVHKSHSGKKYMTIVTKIYRPGCLKNVLEDRSFKLTLKERLKIAYDILTGIASMHTHGYVHRDLGARNYFVDIKGGKNGKRHVAAVVADLGRAIPVSHAVDVAVQGNSGYMAPEGFTRKKMKPKGYMASDLFAVGCVFWQLYYGHLPRWHKFFNQSGSVHQRQAAFVRMLNRVRSHLIQRLLKKQERGSTLSRGDRFLALILRMTDPNPRARGNATELLHFCGTLIAKT